MADLTSDQLLVFRKIHIRDFYDVGPPVVAYSRYNQAYSKEFFTDTDLNALVGDINMTYQQELDALTNEMLVERQVEGDDPSIATATAASNRQLAIYKLLKAECLKIMRTDPGMRQSLLQGGEILAKTMLDEWDRAIRDADMFVTSRTGFYTTIALERM